MKTILITAIGGDIAQSVARIIRESRRSYRLVGVDMQDEHGGTLFVDAFRKIPPASHPEYLAALEAVIKKESVDIVIPMAEVELAVLLPLIETRGDLKWVICGKDVIAAGIDKLATARRLAALGVEVPWTVAVADNQPLAFPCILKDRLGTGSRSVFTVWDSEDALYLAKRHPNSIYQEYLEPADQEITCAVYRTKDSRIATLLLLRKLIGGFTGWAKVVDNPEIAHLCGKIATELNLGGSMNVQLRLTARGPRVFEINPRFSSTALMRHQIGFTDVLWALDELEGKTIRFPSIRPGKVIVRTQSAAVLSQ